MADSDIHEKLYDASVAGEDARVRELLAAGAQPDKYKDGYGWTAVIEAAILVNSENKKQSQHHIPAQNEMGTLSSAKRNARQTF